MKKITILTLLAMAGMSAFAAPRNRQQALAVATRHAVSLGLAPKLEAVDYTERLVLGPRKMTAITSGNGLETTTAGEDDISSFYIFNHASEKGYTIVGGDDRLPEIVAYGTEGSFDNKNVPDGLKFYLDLYNERVAALDSEEGEDVVANANTIKRVQGSTVPISPMVTVHWDQGEPFYNYCPYYDSSNRGLVGCTAVAMGQVLKYHHPSGTNTYSTTIPAYTTYSNSIDVEAITGDRTYNWDNMPNYLSKYSLSKYKEEVAKFLYHVGVSVEMDYGSTSGAWLYAIPNAVRTYFGMDCDATVFTNNYSNAADWIKILDRSLDAQRPVCIAGYTTDGSGHAFVCDGRNSSGYYHINWGWGGSYDAYVDVTVLNCTDDMQFCKSIQLVCNMRLQGEAATTPWQELVDLYEQLSAMVYLTDGTPGSFGATAVSDLQAALATTKTFIAAGQSSATAVSIQRYKETLTAKNNAVLASRVTYEGRYYFETAIAYNDGNTKAMYDAGTNVAWKTLDKYDEAFVWNLKYNATAGAYECYNESTGNRITAATQSKAVSTVIGTSDATTYSILIEPVGYNEEKGWYEEAMHAYNTSGTYAYYHQAEHNSGAGTEGNVVGWTLEAAGSHWHLVPAEEIDPNLAVYKTQLNELVELVQGLVDSDVEPLATTTTEGLIKTADQFYSEYTETSEGNYAGLLDGSTSTFWHSKWTGGDVDPGIHYLQVRLLEPEEGLIKMKMTRRPVSVDHITAFQVRASNDTTDVNSWVDIATISTPYSSNTETLERTFIVPGKYKYLRFYIANTYYVANNVLKPSRGYGHMSEFQLYRSTNEEESAKLGELAKAIQEARSKELPTNADILALREAVREYYGDGDVCADEHLSIFDLTTLITLLQGNTPDAETVTLPAKILEITADVNGDGTLTLSDVQALVEKLIKKLNP